MNPLPKLIGLFGFFWFLLALLIPAALLVWTWWPRTPKLVLPYDHGPKRRGKFAAFILHLFAGVPALLLAVAIIIYAQPMQFGMPKDKRKLTNIELVVDVSSSMTAQWGEGDRYDGAMAAVEQFLNYRKGDAVGLTFFGNNFLHWCPLTTDTSAVKCSVPFMRPGRLPPWFGGTEIGRALKAAAKRIAECDEGDKMIVLVTDGQSSDLFNGGEQEVAKKLKDDNVVMFAIIIGGATAQEELYTLANMVGGSVWEVQDPHALPEIFKRIDAMKPAKVEKALAELFDWFWPFCVVGLSLLGAYALSGFGLRGLPW